MRARTALLISLLGCFVACRTAMPDVIASARADIDAANNGWVPALQQHDAEAIAGAYADDGLFITRDGRVIHGRAAITDMYAARFPQMGKVVDGAVVQDGITAVSNSLIYEWGHAWLALEAAEPGKPPVRSGGSYLTVWQRSADGHWRITRNIAF
jgi:uncharacterized protein (TIGR02246 family)